MIVSFHGVRGSTPSPSPANGGYGGNTSCVTVDVDGAPPIIFDLGTGVRSFGDTLPEGSAFEGVVLLSHLHWDHIQGLPFFGPALRSGSILDIYGPPPGGCTLAEAFERLICPPYFPVTLADLEGRFAFHDVASGVLQFGSATVTVAEVPHIGPTSGYRIEANGLSVAYLSDHQQPLDDPRSIAPSVRQLCQGVDLLIHDAQYTAEEFAEKPNWGHCTIDYALHVAAECDVRRLALFHHDPTHDDTTLDGLVAGASVRAACTTWPAEVIGAAEGTSVILSPPSPQ